MAREKYFHDGDTFEHEGHTFKVTIRQEEDQFLPWDECDGHGPVSDWRRYYRYESTKRPGERVLHIDSGLARYYDVQEATKIAKRDGWGCPHCKIVDGKLSHTHKTRGEMIACAVNRDYDRLRAFCANDWTYVYLIVQEIDEDGENIGDFESIGMMESDDNAGIVSYAYELADQILANKRKAAADEAARQEAIEAAYEAVGLA